MRGLAERSDSSDPMVQLAGLELEQNRLDEALAIVGKIRGRWKEAAAADVLDAQIAIKRGKIADALDHFNAALKKDPDNKMVQFWKAQLDGRTGAVAEATKALEQIVRDKPVKEVEHRHVPPVRGPVGPGATLAPDRAISTTPSAGSRSSSGAARPAPCLDVTAGC